jgi:hypothetical protein
LEPAFSKTAAELLAEHAGGGSPWDFDELFDLLTGEGSPR